MTARFEIDNEKECAEVSIKENEKISKNLSIINESLVAYY